MFLSHAFFTFHLGTHPKCLLPFLLLFALSLHLIITPIQSVILRHPRELTRAPSVKPFDKTSCIPPKANPGSKRLAPLLPSLKAFHKYPSIERPRRWALCSLYLFYKAISPEKDVSHALASGPPLKPSSSRSRLAHLLSFGTLGQPSLKPPSLPPYQVDEEIDQGEDVQILKGTWYPHQKRIFPRNSAIPVTLKLISKNPRNAGSSVISRRIMQRFRREVINTLDAYAIADTGVLQLYDVYLEDPHYWVMVMERVKGDLYALLEDHDSLNKLLLSQHVPDEAIQQTQARAVFKDPLTTLSYLNDAGIIHRNVHPGSIFYTCSAKVCQVKIGDFSLSKGSDGKLETLPLQGSPGFIPLCLLKYTKPHLSCLSTVDVYAIIATIHQFLIRPPIPEIKQLHYLEPLDRTQALKLHINRNQEISQFHALIIKGNLQKIFKAVLDDELWEKKPCSFSLGKEFLRSW